MRAIVSNSSPEVAFFFFAAGAASCASSADIVTLAASKTIAIERKSRFIPPIYPAATFL